MPDAMLPLVLQSLPDHREEHALLNSTTYYAGQHQPKASLGVDESAGATTNRFSSNLGIFDFNGCKR
jgi:hypothetical protein